MVILHTRIHKTVQNAKLNYSDGNKVNRFKTYQILKKL